MRFGKMVVLKLKFTFGTTSSSSSQIRFTLPVGANAAGEEPGGAGEIVDAGTTNYIGQCNVADADEGLLRVHHVQGSYINGWDTSSSVPMAWANQDQIRCFLIYEGV